MHQFYEVIQFKCIHACMHDSLDQVLIAAVKAIEYGLRRCAVCVYGHGCKTIITSWAFLCMSSLHVAMSHLEYVVRIYVAVAL